MKQKSGQPVLGFEMIDADRMRQSVVGAQRRAGYQPNMEVPWPK